MRKKNTTSDIQINDIPLENRKKQSAIAPEIPEKKNKDLNKVAYLFISMFLILIGYLVYFNVIKADEINSNVNNTKQDALSERIVRGSIVSSDGETLAATKVDAEGIETRVYPFNNVFAHVVGYGSNGKSGVEASSNYDLLNSHSPLLNQIQSTSKDEKVLGDSVVLTLDSRLQQAAYDALGAYQGAIVVMEPSTGRILAMVSKPDFDPNNIAADWDNLLSDESKSPLLNRSSQGLYPPGSIFKILTAIEYMRENPNYQSYSYNCAGVIEKENVKITCFDSEVHGTVNLEQAFQKSCNTSFANMGLEIDNNKFRLLCEDFLFNNSLPAPLDASKSRFDLVNGSSFGEEMTTAIGQGDTVVSPLHMAMITSTIANAGTMMKPYLVERIESPEGDVVEETKPVSYKTLMSTEEADIISSYMSKVVEGGTATYLNGQSYTVAGKTGSAEYEIGNDPNNKSTHSWFVGFSNVENPELVISIIAEDGGTGSSAAVPMARGILDAYYNSSYN